MGNQDKELSGVVTDLLHDFWLASEDTEQEFEERPSVIKARAALAASHQLPVAEQPAWQAVKPLEGWSLSLEESGNWRIESASGDSAYVFADDNSPLGEVCRQLVQSLAFGAYAPHSPVAQMSGDEIEECMALAHQWALATYHKALGKEFADIDAIRKELKIKLLTLASHPSNAATQDELAGYRAAIEKIQRLCDAGVTVEAKAIEEVIWNIPPATVPQVVQAPKPAAWTVRFNESQSDYSSKIYEVMLPNGEWDSWHATSPEDARKESQKGWDKRQVEQARYSAPQPVAASPSIVPSDPDCAQAFNDAEDAMCPNCVTPWKCNGPHLAVQPEFDAFYEFFTKEAPKEPGIPGYDMCRHGWLAGIRYALLTTASNAGKEKP